MTSKEKNVRVSFKLSREAAIKLREIALTKGELLCSLGVLAVQLGNESQICISSPLNFNCPPSCEVTRKEKPAEEGFDSELTDSAASDNERMDDDESTFDKGVCQVDRAIALATAASVKLTNEESEETADKAALRNTSCKEINARNSLYQQIHSKKSKRESKDEAAKAVKEELVNSSGNKPIQDLTSGCNSPNDSINNNQSNKFEGPGLSFAQQLINLSKQYRQENPRSPTSNEKYFAPSSASQIVGRDHVLRYFNDKAEDFMGLNVNNSLLFDSYGSSSVKSAEELSKEQSEASPTLATNLDSMSVSSPDSLFEEARLGSVDELSLSPTSATVSTDKTSRNSSPSHSESPKLEISSPLKMKRTMKFQKLLKGQTGVVCELCMHPVQKSYSCYQMAHAPKEIMHLFNDGSRCVRVCRRCLPYKAPKGSDKTGHKKSKKSVEY